MKDKCYFNKAYLCRPSLHQMSPVRRVVLLIQERREGRTPQKEIHVLLGR